jgi:NADPH2:quinone reductase
LIKADGTGVKPGDTVPVHAGAGGVRLMLFGAASGPVPPIDPRRLNAAGSEYLTRPLQTNFSRTYDEFSWRAQELFDAPGVASTSPLASGTRSRTPRRRTAIWRAARLTALRF